MGSIALLDWYGATEITWGLVVTPCTFKWMGLTDASMKPTDTSQRFTEIRSSLAPAYSDRKTKVGAEASLKGILSYDDAPYVLEALLGKASPTGTNPYTYAYTAPLGTAPTSRIYSLYQVDADGSAYAMTGAVGKRIAFHGSSDGELTWEADFLGAKIAVGTLGSPPADRTVTFAAGADVAIYVDAALGTIGTTPVTATAYEFDLELATKRDTSTFFGSISPLSWHEGEQWDATLKLSCEFNATSKAYLDALISTTAVFQKLVRIKATNGTNVIQLDFSGVAEDVPEVFGKRGGVTALEVTLKGVYDAIFANYFKASVTNGVSVLA